MGLTQSISAALPNLRRYARALTGSQNAGDNMIAAVLETLVADPAKLSADKPVKVGLYKMFLENYNREQAPSSFAPATGAEHIADRRLSRISPKPRQAYLLRALEGFSVDDAAYALGVNSDEVASLAAQANQEMMSQVATDVLIIEDEPIVALDLERLVRDLGHDLAGVASTRTEAVELAHGSDPGLVLADVRLADGSSGLDAVTDILRSFDIPVIFITAFPERLLTGERPEPAFLVTKPFRDEAVKALIGQALFFHQRKATPQAA